MSSLTPWITSSTSMGTSSAWASPLTTGEHKGLQQLPGWARAAHRLCGVARTLSDRWIGCLLIQVVMVCYC